MSGKDQVESLTLINDEVKYRLALQREAIDRTDTKTTILVGFVATAAQVLVANRAKADSFWVGVAVAAYLLAFFAGIAAIRIRKYYDAPNASWLIKRYGRSWPEVVLAALVGTRIEAIKINSSTHRRRVLLWWTCLAFLTVGLLATTTAFLRGANR